MKAVKCIAVAALICTLCALCGCWSNIEINELAFVMGIAIDQGATADEYIVTAQVARPSAMNALSGDNGGDAYANITQSGVGIEVPLYKLTSQIDRRLYAGHNQIVLIDMEAAENGLLPILDYFVRSSDGRFIVTLLIAEDSARELFDIKGDLQPLPVMYLKNLVLSKLKNMDASENLIVTFLSHLLSKTSAPMLPVIGVVDDGDGEKRAEVSGMAVFKDAKLCTLLDMEQMHAWMIMQNNSTLDILELDIGGEYINLKILDSTVDIAPVFSGDTLDHMRVDISLGCTIADTSANVDLLSQDVRAEISQIAEEHLLRNLNGALAHTQAYSTDIFGFGEMLYRHHPKKSKSLIDNWEEEYPKLKVAFHAEVEIMSTGAIIHPLVPRSQGDTTIEDGGGA